MNNPSGTFRKKVVPFAQVSHDALFDEILSIEAKGLYSIIQAYITIPGFTLYKNMLKKKCGTGDVKFDRMWKELKEAGYLIQYRFQDKTIDPKTGKAKNTFFYEYELLDVANKELAQKAHDAQNRKTQEEKVHTHQNQGMDKSTAKNTVNPIPPISDPMGDTCNGQVGVYNKILPNNIIPTNNSKDDDSTPAIDPSIINQFQNKWTAIINKKIKLTPKQQIVLMKLVALHTLEFILEALDKYKNNAYLLSVAKPSKFLDEKNLLNVYNGEYDKHAKALQEVTSKNPNFTSVESHNWDLDAMDRREFEHQRRLSELRNRGK